MEDWMTNAPRPEVMEGSQREELKERLLQQMQGDASPMKRPWGWRKKAVWACLLVLVLAGLALAADKALRQFRIEHASREITGQGKNGPAKWSVGGTGSLWADSLEEAKALDEAIRKAIAEEKHELVGMVPGDLFPVYSYKVALPNGSTVQIGYPCRLPARDPADTVQEVQNQIDAGSGELVGVGDAKGTPWFMYKYVLPDGNATTVGTDRPYLGNEKAVYDEVKRLFAQGKGECQWGPEEGLYCYKFVLSNGRLMLYFTESPQPAK